jgi:hypothetical protein
MQNNQGGLGCAFRLLNKTNKEEEARKELGLTRQSAMLVILV